MENNECEECGGQLYEFLCEKCARGVCECKADPDGNHKDLRDCLLAPKEH